MYEFTNEYAFVIAISVIISLIGLRVARLTDSHDMGIITILLAVCLIGVISFILK